MIRPRKLTSVQLKQCKEDLKCKTTIYTFSKLRNILQLWIKHCDKQQSDLAIDTESLKHKVEQLRLHYKL